jgi:hypothetical protein
MTKQTLLRALLPFSLLSVALTLGASTTLSGCGGGETTGGDGACFDYAKFDGTKEAVHFKADVLPIFRTSCGLSTSCHGAESPSAPEQHFLGPKNSEDVTDMQIQAIFDQSVGKASVMNSDMQVINPGKPAESFLMYKLDAPVDGDFCGDLTCAGDKSCGDEMPQGGPQLPADKRDVIRRWIAQGAKND